MSEERSGANAYQQAYAYDPAGNRTLKKIDGGRTTYAYDDANQLETAKDSSGTSMYTFDADGNQQVVLAPNGDRTTNTWDYENRATKILLPDSTICTYAYNGDNLRVHIENNEGTTKVLFDGQQYLAEMDASSDIVVLYTNEPDQYTNLISQREGANSRFLHYDALGSTRQMTDEAGDVTDTFLYDAWGNRITRTGTSRATFQFVGRFGYFYDPATGTFYVLMRIYEPENARWWSVDPLGYGLIAMNLYQYAHGDPVAVADPSGLYPGLFGHGSIISPEDSVRLITDIQRMADIKFDAIVNAAPFYNKRPTSFGRNAYRIAAIALGIGTNENNKFVYTCKYGWIDHGHFFNNAAVTYFYARFAAWTSSDITERLQKGVKSDSAWSPEDLISNKLGRDLGQKAFWNDVRGIALQSFLNPFVPVPTSFFYDIASHWLVLLNRSGAVQWNEHTLHWLQQDLNDFEDNPRNTAIAY